MTQSKIQEIYVELVPSELGKIMRRFDTSCDFEGSTRYVLGERLDKAEEEIKKLSDKLLKFNHSDSPKTNKNILELYSFIVKKIDDLKCGKLKIQSSLYALIDPSNNELLEEIQILENIQTLCDKLLQSQDEQQKSTSTDSQQQPVNAELLLALKESHQLEIRMNNNLGWVCPKCGKVNAPFIPSCDCHLKITTSGFSTMPITLSGDKNDN